MSTSTSFTGSWLVSEYVYTPAGEFVGVVRQRRALQPLGDVIRVIQVCEPLELAPEVRRTVLNRQTSNEGQSRLTGQSTAEWCDANSVANIMNQRVGEFVFDLKIIGKARHYLGPDVLGGGFSWRDGVLTARGLWPNFGYNFTSFSILLHPRKQFTGGKFFTANREICTIVGLATPEDEGYPAFAGTLSAGGFSGTLYEIAPDGTELERRELTVDGGRRSMVGGQSFSYGPLTETEAVAAPGQTVSTLEIADGDFCAGLRKWTRDEKLEKVEVWTLTTDDGRRTAVNTPTALSGTSPKFDEPKSNLGEAGRGA
jgi:hypothetical protein